MHDEEISAVDTRVCVVFSGSLLNAQDITGDWQGKLNAAGGLRMILKVSKSDDGGWTAALYSIDQMPDPLPVSSITLHGADLTPIRR